LALVSVFCADRTLGQDCPQRKTDGPGIVSRVRTLEGRLVFHDDVRQWFELELYKPQCGEKSVQLMRTEKNTAPLEIFRNCRVKSSGIIAFSDTGYYSLGVFQDVESIAPVGTCPRQPPFPDYSKAKPDRSVRAYRVEMHVIYTSGDHPVAFRVYSAGKELRPWQAYASYWMTGGFVLYGECAKGFVIDEVFGTPEAMLGHFGDPGTPTDMAAFDPEGAAASGKSDLHLGYTCIRDPDPNAESKRE